MNTPTNPSAPVATETSSGIALAVAWLFVGIPLVWGVTQTFVKALTLFQ